MAFHPLTLPRACKGEGRVGQPWEKALSADCSFKLLLAKVLVLSHSPS